MIRAELKKYFKTRLFWILNGIGLLVLLLFSLLLLGMSQVGLSQITSYDYLLGATNFYITNFLPLLVCVFMAYAFASEYQWRTMMIPLLEGQSRLSILRGKLVLCLLTVFTFVGVALLVFIAIAFSFFPWNDTLLENRIISPLEAILRISGACLWLAILLAIFGILSMLLVARFRHQILGVMGSFITFMLFVVTAEVHNNPLSPLFRVPRLMVQSANLSMAVLGVPLTQGIFLLVLLGGSMIGLLVFVFTRQDITFE